MPKRVENCNASLSAYLEAFRNEKLDADIVNRLISDLDAVKENFDSGKITIDFSTEQLDALVKLVVDYTRKLAEAHSVELSELQEPEPDSEHNLIIDLVVNLKPKNKSSTEQHGSPRRKLSLRNYRTRGSR
jgi:hypothetical protein